MKFDRFLVVGGAGFVGSHLIDLLVMRGVEKIVVVDDFSLGNIENLSEATKQIDIMIYNEDARYLTALENIIEREKPQVIFNLASRALAYSFINPEGAYMTSVEIAHNLANILRKKLYSRLVQFSTSETYGSAIQVPMTESHPLNPTTPYAAGKASADLLLLSYHNLFDLDISIIRPFNLYGPRQNIGIYAAVIPTTIRRILNGGKPIIEGDGMQTRDLTYVGDLAKAALKLSECDLAIGKVVNLGQGKEMSVKEVISEICKILGHPLEDVEHGPRRPADVRRHLADISLAKKLINYEPKMRFEDGIKVTVESFRKHAS